MGTNFYAKRLPTRRRKEKLINLVYDQMDVVKIVKMIDEGDFYAAKNTVNEFAEALEKTIDEQEKRVHIGKRSYGWQFLWQYYGGKYYKDNLASIRAFLSDPDIVIENEYHETFTVDEFFDKEVSDILYKTDELFDLPSYYKHCREKGERLFESGYDTEFTSDDGLRFCTVDFS